MSHKLTLPVFDSLELTENPEPIISRFVKLSPVKSGVAIPAFRSVYNRGRWHQFFDEITFNEAPGYRCSYKPLLLYFYEKEWGSSSDAHLQQLSAIRNELHHLQVNLLVVTAASLQQFKDQAWVNGLSLEVYEDQSNELAGLLGLHSEQAPAWNSYAGIENNVALPGLYLLGETREVTIAYPNQELENALPVNDILTTLTAESWRFQRKSA